jgi:hypothetical protein
MPVEPLCHQAKENDACRKRIPERDLILDDHEGSGVKALVGKPDSILPMVLPDGFKALRFIERLPGL